MNFIKIILNFTKIIGIQLLLYIIINIACSTVIIASMCIEDDCNPRDDLFVLNIFDLLLYGIATGGILFLYKTGYFIFKKDNIELVDHNYFSTFIPILIGTYIFWHSLIFLVAFLIYEKKCYYTLWFYLRLGCDLLLIAYSIVYMVISLVMYKIMTNIKNEFENLIHCSIVNV